MLAFLQVLALRGHATHDLILDTGAGVGVYFSPDVKLE